MLGVNVMYIMKPGMRDQFLAEVAAVQQTVRREAGCVQYDYFLSADDPDKLLLVEKWTSAEAQKVHSTQPHMDLIAAAKDRCVARSELEFYPLDV
mgnify:CR=1 FL=1